jgi:hypothetical protein
MLALAENVLFRITHELTNIPFLDLQKRIAGCTQPDIGVD